MIIESIELQHVGPFRQKVAIGPLRVGIHVLAAPNETGKTTFLRAAARALFDKHTCKADEIRSLQPAGSDLAPQISVVFEHDGIRYRVQKRFLSNPESEFSEWRNDAWQLLATEDLADERVQKLLLSSVPGRGATKAAHWGMLGFLWARQGEASEWPSWDGDTGQFIQTRLARVEIDPVIDRLRTVLWENYTELFTPTGKPKARGPLDQLEAELRMIAAQKGQVQQQRAELESMQRQYSELGPRLASLEQEAATREQEAKALREQATAAELVVKELQQRQSELAAAKEKLETVSADTEQLGSLAEKLKGTKADLTRAKGALNEAVAKENAAKQLVAAAQQGLDTLAARLKHLTEQKERSANLLKLKETEKHRITAEKLAKRAAVQAESVRKLRAQLDKTANVNPAKLKRLQELGTSIRDHETKLEAIGLTVELTADAAAKVTVKHDHETQKVTVNANQTEVIRAPQSLELHLGGWGRLRIRSGAAELSTLMARLSEDRDAFRAQLAAVDCATLGDAETAVTRRRDLQKEIEAVEEKLRECLEEFESLEELQSKLAALERQTNTLRETLSPTGDEAKASFAELEADAERLNVASREAHAAQAAAMRELKKLREDAEQSGTAREHEDRQRVKFAAEVTAREQQITALHARYPQGLAKAKSDAQSVFVKAEARHEEVQRRLPPDAEKLPDRNKRAAAAYEQVRLEVERRKSEFNKLEGALQARGTEGLHSKLSLLDEREASLLLQIDRLRDRGWAARLAHDLIEFRKQAATRSVLGPLEARLSGTFAEVSRDSERRVFFDEHLQIAGIGVSREAMIGFQYLSQGAKEQMLLCLRLAVAAEVASSGYGLVVLDDVLVNTDSQRQQRVLDLLQTFAGQLQILILTCHPERYRGVGEVVDIRSCS
ncbi:MAG: hypothetical protein WC378_02670 [Opitutaceae bacterium]|jgi:DNA repair exonuclease SbcCD ATPase subunit